MTILLFSIVWFSFLYFGTYYTFRKEEVFSPIKFSCLLFILRNLTYLVLIYFNPEAFPDYVLQALNMSLEQAMPKYIFVQTLAFLSLILGILFVQKKIRPKKISFGENYNSLRKTSIALTLIGLACYSIFISNVGGLAFLLGNLDNRVEMQSGAYILILMQLLNIAIVFRVKMLAYVNSKKNIVYLIIFFLIAVLTSSSLGGRRGTVFIILVLICSYHYFIKKIVVHKIKKLKIILVFLVLSFYTFLIPTLRTPGGFDKIVNGEVNVFKEVNFPELVSYFSYTYIDIFAVNFFNSDNSWNYNSLRTIPENLNIFKRNEFKPPIDEGVYFYNIVKYNLVFEPPTERHKLHIVSLPIENFGFGYANALTFGVITAFFFLGVIYKLIYNYFISTAGNPLVLYVYMFTLFTFNFSSLRIMNAIYLGINILFVLIIYKFFNKKNKLSLW